MYVQYLYMSLLSWGDDSAWGGRLRLFGELLGARNDFCANILSKEHLCSVIWRKRSGLQLEIVPTVSTWAHVSKGLHMG